MIRVLLIVSPSVTYRLIMNLKLILWLLLCGNWADINRVEVSILFRLHHQQCSLKPDPWCQHHPDVQRGPHQEGGWGQWWHTCGGHPIQIHSSCTYWCWRQDLYFIFGHTDKVSLPKAKYWSFFHLKWLKHISTHLSWYI